MNGFPRRGLYAITDPCAGRGGALLAAVEAALRGGASAIQYRDKSTEHARRLREARALAAACRGHDATFVVNDDVELAAASGAHGVHLGRDDASLEGARAVLGEAAVIGVSCYDEPARALAAQAAGASYVAFGRFFPSATKPQAVLASPALLGTVRERLHVPVVAIGGITPDNAPVVMQAGADVLAVVGAVFAAPDVEAAARKFAVLFARHPPVAEQG